ncbi:hydrolase [Mycobacterium avium subsp. hominissuis 10-5606]|nr:hydrolase [Mycobacterium avium subsp. hominissuis 10-5606]
MRIGRYSDPDGTSFWALIEPATESVRRIGGPITEWAASAAAEDLSGLRLGQREPIRPLRPLAPVDSAARVFGVGANYLAHLQKLGVTDPPESPTAFIKPNSALTSPDGVIRYPPTTNQLDYEAELVVVLGGSASEPLLGFTVGNDVSARDAKGIGGLDLFSMKCLDNTSPVGPWIVTPAELGVTQQPHLDIRLRVNGEERQADNTGAMVWSVQEILAYVDARVELRCGDIVFTGTTSGVALEDGRFLQPNDVVEAEIEGIGVLRNTIGERR